MTFPQNPYPVFGFIKNGLGVPIAGITVRVTNQTTNEYADVSTANDGSYLVDLATDLPSGYTNGNSIKVQCVSINKIFTLSLGIYPDGMRIDLVAYLNFTINGVTITGITSMDVTRSLGERVWIANLNLENKNGYRTGAHQAFQPVQIGINGTTLFVGRINKIDPGRQHHLITGCENYSARLLDRIVQSETYSGVSIYNIITQAVTGLIPKYLPSLTTTNVINNTATSQTITKTFSKMTVMECLQYLGDVASTLGYDFWVDNNLDLHFSERRATDSGLTLTNTGTSKNVVDWSWSEKDAKDIFNKVTVYYGSGGASSIERNDLNSQTQYGIREYPPITDETISTVAQANAVGDRLLNKYANPYREGIITVKTNASILALNPSDLVTINLTNSGISQGNTFPWTFPVLFGAKFIIIEVKHMFPAWKSEIKVSEYQKDIVSMFSKLLRRNY